MIIKPLSGWPVIGVSETVNMDNYNQGIILLLVYQVLLFSRLVCEADKPKFNFCSEFTMEASKDKISELLFVVQESFSNRKDYTVIYRLYRIQIVTESRKKLIRKCVWDKKRERRKKDIFLDKEGKKKRERKKKKKKWQEMSFSVKSLVTFSVEVAFEQ